MNKNTSTTDQEATRVSRIRVRITNLSQACDRLWAGGTSVGAAEKQRQEYARELETLQVEHEMRTGYRWYGAKEWRADAWRRRRMSS